MERCSFIPSISAFYDGEMSEARRAEVEAHLSQCAVCQAELDELKALTRAMEADRIEPFGAPAMARWHGYVEELTSERSDYRFAQWLSGIAAALLIGVGGWLMATPAPAGQSSMEWERAAMMRSPELPAESMHPAQRVLAEFAMQR